MKKHFIKKSAVVTFLLLLMAVAANAQYLKGQFYYLEHPSTSVFFSGYTSPDPQGRFDPQRAVGKTVITESDIETTPSATRQAYTRQKDKNTDYLFGTYNRVRNLQVTSDFYNVKYARLKDDSWQKINDNLYHVVEALRSDSAIFSVKRTSGDTAGTAVIEKIVALFLSGSSDLGKVLSVFGTTDTGSKISSKNILKLRYGNKDSVSFYIADSNVYYAVRYARLGDYEDRTTRPIWGKLSAPKCAPQFKVGRNPATPYISGTLRPTQTIYPLINDCDFEGLRMNFVYDPAKGIQNVYILQTIIEPGRVASRSNSRTQRVDTLYDSGPIDFANEFYNREYTGTFRYVSNVVPGRSRAKNIVVECSYAFKFDPQTRKIIVSNYNDEQFSTYITTGTATIDFYPKKKE